MLQLIYCFQLLVSVFERNQEAQRTANEDINKYSVGLKVSRHFTRLYNMNILITELVLPQIVKIIIHK